MRKALPLKYINALGESIDLTTDGYKHDSPEMFSYSWNYRVSRKKVRRFWKTETENKIEAWIDRWVKQEGIDRRNMLVDIAESDVRNNTPGRFYVNEVYVEAFVIASNPQGYLADGRHMVSDLSVLLPDPNWWTESKHEFYPWDNEVESDYLDFPFDFPFDFMANAPTRSFVNEAKYPSDFKIVIYGFVSNPAIRIGGNLYQVSEVIQAGERLEIDSREKSITLIDASGNKYNVYDSRLKGDHGTTEYIFNKILPGFNTVIMPNSFGFTLFLYDAHSIPRWEVI